MNWELELYKFVVNYYLLNGCKDKNIVVNGISFILKYNEIKKSKFLEAYSEKNS